MNFSGLPIRLQQFLDSLFNQTPAKSGTAARYGLPGTISLRALPYGPAVADYATDVALRTQGGGVWPGCTSILLTGSALFLLLSTLTPEGYNLLIAATGGVMIPGIGGTLTRRLRARKLPRMDIRHLETGDLRRDLDSQTQTRVDTVRRENLPRLACVIEAVNTYNRFHRQVEVTLRTLELKGAVAGNTVNTLRQRLQQKHDELTKMVAIFGSLLDGEMQGVILDEDGRSALLTSSLASDGSAMDIDTYLGRVLDNLEDDIRTIDHTETLENLPS